MEQLNMRETLEKQVRLLSERSEKTENAYELALLTEAMTKLISAPWPSSE